MIYCRKGKCTQCLIFTAALKFHNVYEYSIVSENHKPWVHPSHVRKIGQLGT